MNIIELNKITVLIISYKSLERLKNCIKTIGSNKKIIVIENSDDERIKKSIENEYNKEDSSVDYWSYYNR